MRFTKMQEPETIIFILTVLKNPSLRLKNWLLTCTAPFWRRIRWDYFNRTI